jgi:hypothetical protein
MPFLDSLDIANRALQHCGQPQIALVTEDSKNNLETAFAYDKVRRAELKRNLWVFATRKVVLRAIDVNTMLIVPALYSASTTYLPGAIVVDANNQMWLSMQEGNLNNTPGGNNEAWDAYFGSKTIVPYDSTTTYWTGELVYMPGANPGSYAIFQSMQNGNSDVPNVATAWNATTQFNGNSVVSSAGRQWSSNIEVNLNIVPAVGPAAFVIGTTYSTGNTVTASDAFIYSSVGNGNVGYDPTTDGGVHWTNTGVANAWTELAVGTTVASTNWRVINATMKNLSFSYPIGAGPSSEVASRNAFRLPAGFLQVAPQDPKAGANSVLGGPSALQYDDWEFNGDYVLSSDTGPVLFRFISDVTVVSQMDDMFCEGLACRIAAAICSPLTQSDGKLQLILSEYKVFMGEARTANAIEVGPIEPPEDDWVTCRT